MREPRSPSLSSVPAVSTKSQSAAPPPAFYYTGRAATQVLRQRTLTRREQEFNTSSPKWAPQLPEYDARIDPYCPLTRTSAYRRALMRVERTDAINVERMRSRMGRPLPTVRAAGISEALLGHTAVQELVVRAIEAYEFELSSVRRFVDTLPADLHRSNLLPFAREKLADLIASFRLATLNVVEMAEHWRRRSARPTEPLLWAGANLLVSIQLDVLDTFAPLRTARDPLLLRCFPTAATAGSRAAHGARRSPLARPAARLSRAEVFDPTRLHLGEELARMRLAERLLAREADAAGAVLRDHEPEAGAVFVRVPRSAELKLRVLCFGSAAVARWHSGLLEASATVIQAHVRRHRAEKAHRATRGEASVDANFGLTASPGVSPHERFDAAAAHLQAHARRMAAQQSTRELLAATSSAFESSLVLTER